MPQERSLKYSKKQIIHLVIALFFMFGFGYLCPTWGGITRMGVQAIGIFIGSVWLVANRFGLVVPALLMMFSITFCGYATSSTIISQTIGGSIVWQLILIFVLIYALQETGADGVLARWLVSRKGLNGRPLAFIVVFMVAITFFGAIASALGAYLFSAAMIDSIGDSVGYEKRSQWRKAMLTGAIICASMGGGILPFKGMALMIYNLMATGIVEAGLSIDQVSYMIAAVLAGVLVSVGVALAIRYLFKIDFTKLANADVVAITSAGGTRFNKAQAIAMIIFFVGIGYSIVMIWYPATAPGYTTLTNIGQAFWFSLMVAIIGLLHVDGKPLMNVERDMAKAVNWGIVLIVCGFTALGGMIADKELGIQGWLSGIMNVVFGNMPFWLFVIVLVLMTLLLTNVFSNTATAVIIGTVIGPIIIEYGQTLGINTSVLIPGIVMTALCAYLTMAAGGSAPLYLGSDVMKEDTKWPVSWGLVFIPIIVVFSSVAYIGCAYLL